MKRAIVVMGLGIVLGTTAFAQAVTNPEPKSYFEKSAFGQPDNVFDREHGLVKSEPAKVTTPASSGFPVFSSPNKVRINAQSSQDKAAYAPPPASLPAVPAPTIESSDR